MVSTLLEQKIQDSYEVLRLSAEISKEYYQKPLIITYSGGKDSDVILQLAIECLTAEDFEVVNSHTTVDAPETVYHIRDKFKTLNQMGIKTTVQYPHDKDGNAISMWSLIPKKQIPPTRFSRYCCEALKETTSPDRFIAMGVRESESKGRANRDMFATQNEKRPDFKYFGTEHIREVFEDDKTRRLNGGGIEPNVEGAYDCVFISSAKKREKTISNPIYKWTDNDVWEFIHERKLKYNPLYDKGFRRVGCLGCPLASGKVMMRELDMYPKYKENYIKAFDRMLVQRRLAGKDDLTGKSGRQRWINGEAVYRWWVRDDATPGQMTFEDYENDKSDGRTI